MNAALKLQNAEISADMLFIKNDLTLVKNDIDIIKNDLPVAKSDLAVIKSKHSTKTDISNLTALMHRELHALTWKLVGIASILVSVVYFIATQTLS